MSSRLEPSSNISGIFPISLLYNFLGVLLGFLSCVCMTGQHVYSDGGNVLSKLHGLFRFALWPATTLAGSFPSVFPGVAPSKALTRISLECSLDSMEVSGSQLISVRVVEKLTAVLGFLRLALWPAAMLTGSGMSN